MVNKMNTQKIDIKLSEILNYLQNGLTWYKHEDVGYGSIQENYNATDLQIKMLQKHPKLVDIQPTIIIFNIIDDTINNEIIYIKENKEEIIENIDETQSFLNI